jgi:regulator of protease activity HflC (stomatin/prohibitin superfamily)
VLSAEGAKQAAVLSAEGERQAAILRAEGEAKAIDTVFKAIHEGKPDRALLSYEYLKMLPELAEGEANKVFVVPSEFAEAFGGIGEVLKGRHQDANGPAVAPAPARPQVPPGAPVSGDDASSEGDSDA